MVDSAGDAGEGRELVGSNLAVDPCKLAHESALAYGWKADECHACVSIFHNVETVASNAARGGGGRVGREQMGKKGNGKEYEALGVKSSVLSLARRALRPPMWRSVALFFCVRAISSSISLIRSQIPMVGEEG